jgi:RNA polymerase-binding transcription factor DksA
MGAHKSSSKKHKPQAKSAHKTVKKTAPKPTKSKAANKHSVVKKTSHPHASAKSGKHAAPAPAHPAPKAKAAPHPAPPASAKAKPAPAPVEPGEAGAKISPDELRRQLVAKAKSRAKPQRAVAFTLDDVRGELAKARPTGKTGEAPAKLEKNGKSTAAGGSRVINDVKPTHRRYGAASLADILGYNPAVEEKPEDEEASIDKKFIRYYKLLAQLRDHVKSGLALHADETLKRSSREDAGDLSGYGQHMADAGTDAFDRDFALSLVSSEQEALFEIEEAIKRIKNGTYGVCELTGKPINKDRLLAVPFARYSVESQAEMEKTRRRSSQHGGLFGDAAGEEGAKIAEDDGE